MCLICIDWEAGKLSAKEAFKNIGESLATAATEEERKHLFELSDRLLDKEVPTSEADSEMDSAWHKETYDN
jgi:hypothetical protein